MKTLENHVLIYDKNCPLCKAYTSAFLRTGMLDSRGREAYNCLTPKMRTQLDIDRARNEIALLDRQSGHVDYGIDSLFKIIGNGMPFLKPLFALKPFRFLMKQLYSFISYNRKVIIPSKPASDACVPDVNYFWRWMYILLTCTATASVLGLYSLKLSPFVPASHFFREFLICGGQILFQAIALYFIDRKKILTYLGNMMTISFAGAMLLSLFMGIAGLTGIAQPLIYLYVFGMTVSLMFYEHLRRMNLLGIHWSASASWILYRLIVLPIIL